MFICELIDDKGNPQGFEAYGPPSQTKEAATVFTNREAAELAAMSRYGRSGAAFWESERKAAEMARKRHNGWTFNIIAGA